MATEDTAAARLRAVVSRMTPGPWTPDSYNGILEDNATGIAALRNAAESIAGLVEAAAALAVDILTNDGWCYCGQNALRDGHDEGCRLDPALIALDALRDSLPPLSGGTQDG